MACCEDVARFHAHGDDWCYGASRSRKEALTCLNGGNVIS